ncbi:MAG: polyprenyl synthetase family protein [Propionibacteriaceae bacterium]|nr:polyprenyl synthetase family protein [Propionibacteriaceae bacterium]
MPLTDEQFADWVADRVNDVVVRLHETVSTPNTFVEEVARYLPKAGGKMYRPALVMAVGGLGFDAGQVDVDALVDAAVVVELTHVASLYHDDVMDEAQVRRGQPTVNVNWCNSVAILAGDFMLAQASLVGAKLGVDFMAYQALTLSRLVQGQIAESRRPDPGVDPIDHHLGVLAGKTGALIAASARYGAVFAGLSPDQIDALTLYGERLGMAFQLADDLMDILSQESGKNLGTDLREGVPTLTTLLVQRARRPEDARLLDLLSGPVVVEDLPEALALLKAHPALVEARSEVRRWADSAETCLAPFPDSPATRVLHTLCEQAVSRTA